MNAEEKKLTLLLEARMTELADEYNNLKKKYAEALDKIDSQQGTIAGLQIQVKRLQNDYANLKMAKMIDISDDDIKDAKTRLSKLVREVDKCIALLNI